MIIIFINAVIAAFVVFMFGVKLMLPREISFPWWLFWHKYADIEVLLLVISVVLSIFIQLFADKKKRKVCWFSTLIIFLCVGLDGGTIRGRLAKVPVNESVPVLRH